MEDIVVSSLERLKQILQIKYRKLEYFLGLQINRTATALYIHREKYTTSCSNNSEGRNVNRLQLDFAGTLPQRTHLTMYKSAKYKMAFAMSFLSRHPERPTKKIWSLFRGTLRYLHGTSRYGIRYEKNGDENYHSFRDSDYASCPLTRHSVAGNTVVVNQGPIFWNAALQKKHRFVVV